MKKEKNNNDVNITISLFDKLSIELDNNYLNFPERQIQIRIHFNEFQEKKYFVILDEESKGNNIISSDEWKQLLSSQNSIYNVERERLIHSLMVGIPSNLRGSVWKFLSKSENVYFNHEKSFFKNL